MSPRAWKQRKPTPLDRGPPLHVNRPLDFKILISDLKLNSKFENRFQRWDICFWKSDKGFEKLSLRTAVLHAYAWLAKRRPLFMRIVLQILFRISRSNATSEIHEIRFWISQLKSVLRRWNPFLDFAFDCNIRNPIWISKSKSGFHSQSNATLREWSHSLLWVFWSYNFGQNWNVKKMDVACLVSK